jgi:hypothetical protein
VSEDVEARIARLERVVRGQQEALKGFASSMEVALATIADLVDARKAGAGSREDAGEANLVEAAIEESSRLEDIEQELDQAIAAAVALGADVVSSGVTITELWKNQLSEEEALHFAKKLGEQNSDNDAKTHLVPMPLDASELARLEAIFADMTSNLPEVPGDVGDARLARVKAMYEVLLAGGVSRSDTHLMALMLAIAVNQILEADT